MKPAAPPAPGRTSIVVVVLLGICLAVFWQVGRYPFIGLDDPQYISRNHYVMKGLSGEGFAWAFTSSGAGNWHPLTWLSHMLDVELFGLDAGSHHRVSVLFHGLNTVVIFLVLSSLTGGAWRSAFVAALFAAHPLHVESVAWAAERKDVLSGFFWITTMGAYSAYVRRPAVGRYLLLAILFALGLLSKPMLVTLPFALLLLDWWPLGRWPAGAGRQVKSEAPRPGEPAARLLGEKAPLLLMAAASSIVTYLVQARSGAVATVDLYPLWVRVMNAPVAYARYLVKTAWPADLAVYYPHPGVDLPLWQAAVSTAVLIAVTTAVVRQRNSRPHLLFGWLWFLGTLVPVIGLVQVGMQSMADRYTYLPLLGIFVMAAWSVPGGVAAHGTRKRALTAAAAIAVLLTFGIAAWRQTGFWRSDAALFGNALEVTSGNWLAHEALGIDYLNRGNVQGAVRHIEEALRIRPRFPLAHYNLGVILQGQGRIDEAIDRYREALLLRPGYGEAHVNLGVLLMRRGNVDEAALHFREALAANPLDAFAHNNLGELLLHKGMPSEAVPYFREALRLRPGYREGAANLRRALDLTPRDLSRF